MQNQRPVLVLDVLGRRVMPTDHAVHAAGSLLVW